MRSFDGYVAAINHRQATLAQVRKAKRLTQQQLAAALDVSQAQVSRIEATDINVMLITLANFIEATGGELHVIATYPGDDPVELVFRDSETVDG